METECSKLESREITPNVLVSKQDIVVNNAEKDHASVHKDKARKEEDENTCRPDSSSEATPSRVGISSGEQDEEKIDKAVADGDNLTSMDSDQLRIKVEELNDTVDELEEALHQKSTEVNAKNEVLRRNAGIMRNMHIRNQQKDQKIQEMTSRLTDLEKKVDAMEEFETSLVKTMVNPDMKEIVETVKEQREKILQLEKKVREKEEEVEQAEALLDEMNEGKEEKVTPAMLRLRGINVTMARGDEVRETTSTAALETDWGKSDGLPRRMENGGGKPAEHLASVLRANMGLTVQRPLGQNEGRCESDDEGENETTFSRGSEEVVQEQQTSPADMSDLLRARGVTIERAASTVDVDSTPPSSTATQSSLHPHNREERVQDGDSFTDEDENREEESYSNTGNTAAKRTYESYDYIEEERERRREKRMREFEEEVKSDAFWSSFPDQRNTDEEGDDDDMWQDEDDFDDQGCRVREWEHGELIVREWEEGGRRVLQWKVDGWKEECPDCLKGWVHLCPDDANFPN